MSLTQNLLERTYQLLDASTLTYAEIADGAGVDINWLAKFKQRAIGEPGVSKVQGVHDFLTERHPAPRKQNGGKSAPNRSQKLGRAGNA